MSLYNREYIVGFILGFIIEQYCYDKGRWKNQAFYNAINLFGMQKEKMLDYLKLLILLLQISIYQENFNKKIK